MKSNSSAGSRKTSADSAALPAHVAIIMDGNGRWAEQRGLPRLLGHREGAKSVRRITTHARKIGIKYLTLYAFSHENWARPEPEVSGLMGLLRDYLLDERSTIMDNNIRLTTIGATDRLPTYAQEPLATLMEESADNDGMTLTLALSYSGREELARACRELAGSVARGELKPESITAEMVAARLDTASMPNPDLLIRTSGEMRISNFMLWQLAYTEFFITDVLWPQFTEAHFDEAVALFSKRSRRFGLTGEQLRAAERDGKIPSDCARR